MPYRDYLIFDVETIPIPGVDLYIEEPEAPSNYKDPLKISEYVQAKRAELIDRAALDIDLCEVVAIGFKSTRGDSLTMSRRTESEADMLRIFWGRVVDAGKHSTRELVGFNCLGFDLPVLMRRSLYLNVVHPRIRIDRYRHAGVVDLLQVMSFNGQCKYRSLDFYSERLGIPHDDTTKGSDISRLAAAGQWGKIEDHCTDDVNATYALAERIGVFNGDFGVEA